MLRHTMSRLHTHRRHVCYCHQTKQFYYPARIVHGMGSCPYCDAYGRTRTHAAYRPHAPQWHPLRNAAAIITAELLHAADAARRSH